uniref:Uncharacterized protein n=1 Tax=Physcomitrium patens TaxID=3218 RepID=A0A2K1KJ67_PHYPA|nr:hypothetical protein PHYPA_007501 [Physcomitrium patens]
MLECNVFSEDGEVFCDVSLKRGTTKSTQKDEHSIIASRWHRRQIRCMKSSAVSQFQCKTLIPAAETDE